VLPYDDMRYYALKIVTHLANDGDFDALQANIAADCVIKGAADDDDDDGDDDDDADSTLIGAGSVADLCHNTVDLLLRVKIANMSEVSFVSRDADAGGSGDGGKRGAKAASLSAHKTLLSTAWLAALRMPLPPDVYRVCMINLYSEIMPCLASPLPLADFLTDTYNQGGLVALLALDGLFHLISKHNLDYPDFYGKLYRVCTPAVFHAKHCNRFFKLVALFLTSPFLPAYLVSAFAKRFGRLALTAPPGGAVFSIVLIFVGSAECSCDV
jgi:U3 small nucleolar RNA-associated protein 19